MTMGTPGKQVALSKATLHTYQQPWTWCGIIGLSFSVIYRSLPCDSASPSDKPGRPCA
jgi:hypothetical protein